MAFFCPVDASEWEQRNRVRLYRDKLQRWVMAIAVDQEDSQDEIASRVKRWMNFIFQAGPVIGRDIGAATDFHVIDVNRIEPSMPAPSQRREQLDPLPFLKPGPVAFVTLEFAWRGPAAEMPWPVTRLVGSRLHGVNTMCPMDANMMLIATKEGEGAPERKLDDRGLGGDVGDFFEWAKNTAGMVLTGLVLAGGAWLIFTLEKK